LIQKKTHSLIVLVVWVDSAPVDGATHVGVITVMGIVPLPLAVQTLPPQGALVIVMIYPISVTLATIK
jgi:hypothetical protein